MSTIQANTLSNLAGTGPTTLTKQWAAKAFASLNGNGTISLNKSQNIASITDNATGNYALNFTSSFDSANYAMVACGTQSNGNDSVFYGKNNDGNFTAGQATTAASQGATRLDNNPLGSAFFGDLA